MLEDEVGVAHQRASRLFSPDIQEPNDLGVCSLSLRSRVRGRVQEGSGDCLDSHWWHLFMDTKG